MSIFYLNATGNCLAVAKRIGSNPVSIPQIIGANDARCKLMHMPVSRNFHR